MIPTQLHEFHFVLDRNMRLEIEGLKMYKETGSLSKVIVRIISLLFPILKKEHKWGCQRESKYMPVSSDPDSKRDHVHVYFPEKVYRKLKAMYSDLNWYSIAQLIRGFLQAFLCLVKMYGDLVVQEIKRLYKQWADGDNNIRPTPIEVMRQLWLIIQHLHGQEKRISIYNSENLPIWIFNL